MKEYRRKFEIFAAPLSEIPETVLEGNFINGLSPMIRAEVRMLNPQGLGHIMELAYQVKDRNESV